jgi:histidyl-tRNA synthetase
MTESNKQIQRLAGTRDVLPDEYELRQRVWKAIAHTFEKFGYRGIEVPTIEYMELHLRKSGESIRQNMYLFKDLGQNDICLRPELTASVARMFTAGLQNEPLPLKLYYLGSAFRHDKPQTGRYREFTQAGVELLGGKSPEFDAEVIALACNVMDDLGITNYKVVIGNIGIVLELLSQKKIEERAKVHIIERLEAFSKIDAASKEEAVKTWIKDVTNSFETIGISLSEPSQEKLDLLGIVKQLPEEHITKVVGWVLETIYGVTDSRRASGEIAGNLIAKIRRDEQAKQIIETLEFISRLMAINEDRPEEVLKQADALITESKLDPKPIEEMRAMAKYLECLGVDWNRVKFDFGFGRGLQYYTGMIFEMYVESEKLGLSQKQVCGGGRYDSLISDLGAARPVPALGFSFGLERLTLCLPENLEELWRLDAFVAPIGQEEEFQHALQTAKLFRSRNLRVDVGQKGMAPRDSTGMSKRLRARYTVFIGQDELKNNIVSLRDMKSYKQEKCTVEKAAEIIANGVVS